MLEIGSVHRSPVLNIYCRYQQVAALWLCAGCVKEALSDGDMRREEAPHTGRNSFPLSLACCFGVLLTLRIRLATLSSDAVGQSGAAAHG